MRKGTRNVGFTFYTVDEMKKFQKNPGMRSKAEAKRKADLVAKEKAEAKKKADAEAKAE